MEIATLSLRELCKERLDQPENGRCWSVTGPKRKSTAEEYKLETVTDNLLSDLFI